MATPQRNADNFVTMEDNHTVYEDNTTEHMDSIQKTLVKLQSLTLDKTAETGTLWSSINEQLSLICMLKQRADEQLLRCQTLQKLNTELEGRVTECQTELDSERKRAELLDSRFAISSANNQKIITFMQEYRNENIQTENDTLFSQKLQDKEVLVQKLMQEINHLTEKHANEEIKYREKVDECQSKLLEQAHQQQAMERSLLDQLSDTRQQHRDAVKMCKDLELRLQKAEDDNALLEINMRESIRNLTEEKDKLLDLSMERGKIIQEKQEEIQQLETKCKQEKKARAKAEDRFKKEAESVNADVKVKSLQSALDESNAKYRKFNKEFEAFKEHMTSLLQQERELNKTLRHMRN